MRHHLRFRSPSRRSRRTCTCGNARNGRVDRAGRIDGRTASGGSGNAVPQLPRVTPTLEGNPFKLGASDFKIFFRADTARTLGYVAIFAIASAPWDREGVNNGFNIPDRSVSIGQRDRQFRVPGRRRLRNLQYR